MSEPNLYQTNLSLSESNKGGQNKKRERRNERKSKNKGARRGYTYGPRISLRFKVFIFGEVRSFEKAAQVVLMNLVVNRVLSNSFFINDSVIS